MLLTAGEGLSTAYLYHVIRGNMFPKSLPSPNNTNIQKHVEHNRGSEIATIGLLRNMFVWQSRGDAAG